MRGSARSPADPRAASGAPARSDRRTPAPGSARPPAHTPGSSPITAIERGASNRPFTTCPWALSHRVHGRLSHRALAASTARRCAAGSPRSRPRSARPGRPARSAPARSSSIRPMPPWICSASSATFPSISVAASLAIAIAGSAAGSSRLDEPGRAPGQPRRGLQRRAHVGELERHPLVAPDGPAELAPGRRMADGQVERAARPAQAARGDLQAGRAQPGGGHVEAAPDLAEHRRPRHPAAVEDQHGVAVAAMRDAAVAGQHGEPGRVDVDQERGDLGAAGSSAPGPAPRSRRRGSRSRPRRRG